ncbi:MAG TPA: apolipoprotein N-acyltransferase [Steroidobacteraceae bacterium]|nr:apolipoprotein N-acyltransferase [Steroidobacteraceae bacterium]
MSRRRQSLISFIAGAALTLAFAPFDLWPMAVACPAVLFSLWQGATPRRAAWLGFLFSSATFLAGTYWLYISIHGFGKAPIPVALLLMLGLVVIMGAYCALIGHVAARWLPPSGALRWLIGLPSLWVFVEWFRGWFLSGFPWLSLGYAGIDSWLAGFAPVTGVYGLSLLLAATAGALVAAAFGEAKVRRAAGLLVAVVWLAGWALEQVKWTEPGGAPVSVALVQGAVPQDEKWELDSRLRTLKLYRELSERGFGAKLIVLPEASLPLLAHELGPFLEPLERDAEARGGTVVVGMLRYDPAGGHYFNSLFALGTPGAVYDKRRLVPFGEFFPVPASVRHWMRLMSLPYIDMTPGADAQPPLDAAGMKLGATICYEDAWGSIGLATLGEAHLMVNVTNDAWFGDSTAAHQHLEIARMRSLEAGRYQVRVANDGITAIIDAHGKVLDRIARFKPAVLKGEVVPYSGVTPYARVGNWPVVTLAALLALFGLGVGIVRQRVRPSE